jgi:hypothetical protein
MDWAAWWELHLRKARGETLSEQEERLYAAEAARQDQDAPPLQGDLQGQAALCQEKDALRARVSELEKEIQLSRGCLR